MQTVGELLKKINIAGPLLFDEPMYRHTSFRIGGPADVYLRVRDEKELERIFAFVLREGLPYFVLGEGANILVSDLGIRGLVLDLRDLNHCRFEPEGPLLIAGAGSSMSGACEQARDHGLTGLEFACGIPGSVGGGVATNAGAYGKAFSDVLAEVQVASAEGVSWVPTGELEWEYRHCRLPAGTVVTAVRFHLERDERETILERHRSTLEMRRSVQPQGVKTFGSTFKNPSGGAAGRLLDAAGLKGERRGGAEVSKVHANFVVNLGDASTADVLDLMDHMRHMVHETSGVLLEPEVRLLGADFPWRSSADEAHWLSSADG